MSAKKTGALIVMERGIPLEEYIKSGIRMDSLISSQLLLNIFEKDTPLHDGAIIVENDRVESATCYLPLSTNYSIDKKLGTRHRAAIGITENSDSVVVVVSEETGAISFCVGGKIKHDVSKEKLIELLKNDMIKEETVVATKKKRTKYPLWFKCVALIASILVWYFVINTTDPIITKTIYNIPVTKTNTEILDDVGQTYTVNSGDSVTIKVKGRRSLVDPVAKEDIIATADFSSMSIVYAVPISVSFNQEYSTLEVVSMNTDVMKIAVEDMVQVEVPVETKIIGDTNSQFYVHVKHLETQSLFVTCPESLSKTLNKAVLTIDAYGKESDFITTGVPDVYDKNGTKIDDSKISLSQRSVRADIAVFKTKEVPLVIELTEQKTTSDVYYQLNGYVAEVETVHVAADEETLSQIETLSIVLSPNSKSGDVTSMMINLPQYLPENVYLTKHQNEQISVEMDLTQYQKKSLPLTSKNITVVGIDDKLYDVKVVGVPSFISIFYDTSLFDPSTLTMETLKPSLKIETVSEGEYDGVVTVADIDNTFLANEIKVKYTLKEREDN